MDAFPPAFGPIRFSGNNRRVKAACCGLRGCPRGRASPTYMDACHARWAFWEMGWTQAAIANELRLSSGTVSRLVRGERFPGARPVPMPAYARVMCGRSRQSDFGF
jgi:hypothetical protein